MLPLQQDAVTGGGWRLGPAIDVTTSSRMNAPRDGGEATDGVREEPRQTVESFVDR